MTMTGGEHTPYARIGGEAGVRQLVKVFYDLVETTPEGEPLMVMHRRGNGVTHAREAQFMFLSGFLGGPQLYVEQHRHANVKQMHAHLEIGKIERDSWLQCMDMALSQAGADAATHELLMKHFTRVADVLRNKPEADDNPLRVTSA